MQRRQLLYTLGLTSTASYAAQPLRGTPQPPSGMRFPRDFGAHLKSGIEWWYITGWANTQAMEAALGFQITFFRSRVEPAQDLRSPLAARQLLFAHAAVTDVPSARLYHDQRMARWSGQVPGANPLDRASASTQDTGLVLRDWSLLREGKILRARASTADFALDLRLEPTQAVLLQGDAGLSRKSPLPDHYSHYYSLPHLQASGSIQLKGIHHSLAAGSTAWLDQEWSNSLMDPEAVGWDWIGMNLDNGCALTAFQMRQRDGSARWHGGSLRCGSTMHRFASSDLQWTPQRYWTSPASQARYPVQWLLSTPQGQYTVHALVDGQELDSRSSTGAVYWEGLSELRNSQGQRVGRGYLEMTGYASPLKL